MAFRGFLAVTLLPVLLAAAPSPSPEPPLTLTRAQALEDLSWLRRSLEYVYPSLYKYDDKAAVDKRFEGVATSSASVSTRSRLPGPGQPDECRGVLPTHPIRYSIEDVVAGRDLEYGAGHGSGPGRSASEGYPLMTGMPRRLVIPVTGILSSGSSPSPEAKQETDLRKLPVNRRDSCVDPAVLIASLMAAMAVEGRASADGPVLRWPSPEFRDLQAAIDAAPDGATLELGPGVFAIREPLQVKGKRLVIRGAGSGLDHARGREPRRPEGPVTPIGGPSAPEGEGRAGKPHPARGAVQNC